MRDLNRGNCMGNSQVFVLVIECSHVFDVNECLNRKQLNKILLCTRVMAVICVHVSVTVLAATYAVRFLMANFLWI